MVLEERLQLLEQQAVSLKLQLNMGKEAIEKEEAEKRKITGEFQGKNSCNTIFNFPFSSFSLYPTLFLLCISLCLSFFSLILNHVIGLINEHASEEVLKKVINQYRDKVNKESIYKDL